MSHIIADFIINGDSLFESDYERERFLYQKELKATVKKYTNHNISTNRKFFVQIIFLLSELRIFRFRKRSLNTLVISWNTDVEIEEVNSDWIIYFDMPPSYKKYILSRKFANDKSNSNYFFLEETGNQEKFDKDKNSLEEFVDLDLALKQVSCTIMLDAVTHRFRKGREK